MPLSASALAAVLKSQFVAAGFVNVNTPPDLDNACEAIAQAVVDHVVNNLQIQIPALTVIVAAPGGTPNPAPLTCTVA
jgi:hypothetical protein